MRGRPKKKPPKPKKRKYGKILLPDNPEICSLCGQRVGRKWFMTVTAGQHKGKTGHLECAEEANNQGYAEMDFSRSPNEGFSGVLQGLLDSAIQAERAKESPRTYLGASRLGVQCVRQLHYEYVNHPKDQGRDFEGRILRIFDRGHDGEERAASYLRMAGFKLHTETPGGGQFRVLIMKDRKTGDWIIKGHSDGIIESGPFVEFGELAIRYPCVWENKIVGEKKFKEFMSKGVKKADIVYYTQASIYSKYLGTNNPALFTAFNANTMELYAELIPIDEGMIAEAERRGFDAVTAQRPDDLPRIASDRSAFACKFCSYQDSCWSLKSANTAGQAAPSWFGGA